VLWGEAHYRVRQRQRDESDPDAATAGDETDANEAA
jgi:hypothetical protein